MAPAKGKKAKGKGGTKGDNMTQADKEQPAGERPAAPTQGVDYRMSRRDGGLPEPPTPGDSVKIV